MSEKSAFDRDGRRKYLSQMEGNQFRRRARNLAQDRTLFCLTLYFTGCRISEVLSLRPQDVDARSCVVLVATLKQRRKNVIRRIPVPRFLAKKLSLTGAEPNERIWKFSRTTGWRIVKSVMVAADIAGIHATTKGLRHGFGVRGLLNKIPLRLVQQWMGHAHWTTTAIYMDVRDEEERDLMRRTWRA